MATVKAVAKKVTAKPSNRRSLVFEAELKRETPGAVVFAEDAERDDQISGSIYIRKAALGDERPTRVRVTIEVI